MDILCRSECDWNSLQTSWPSSQHFLSLHPISQFMSTLNGELLSILSGHKTSPFWGKIGRQHLQRKEPCCILFTAEFIRSTHWAMWRYLDMQNYGMRCTACISPDTELHMEVHLIWHSRHSQLGVCTGDHALPKQIGKSITPACLLRVLQLGKKPIFLCRSLTIALAFAFANTTYSLL